jgi:hypothetical protein
MPSSDYTYVPPFDRSCVQTVRDLGRPNVTSKRQPGGAICLLTTNSPLGSDHGGWQGPKPAYQAMGAAGIEPATSRV